MALAAIGGVRLFYETTGQGFPLILCHELAANYRCWDDQVRYFSRLYRVITYNARGYPPSDVPQNGDDYSQDRAAEDICGLMRHLDIKEAYVAGLSMGGSATLAFGLAHPEMARALIVAGTGTGSTNPEQFRQQARTFADDLESRGMKALADYARGPGRVQLLRKDPKGWEEFNRMLMEYSPLGCALTLRGCNARRPTIFQLEDKLRRLQVPTLIIAGDEDDPCIEPAIFMKRVIPKAGLAIFPKAGHTLNLEEPELFNETVHEFLLAVEAGRWGERDLGTGVGFVATQK
jgi:pimeloyl-ACP methyl ester carboxylesterase